MILLRFQLVEVSSRVIPLWITEQSRPPALHPGIPVLLFVSPETSPYSYVNTLAPNSIFPSLLNEISTLYEGLLACSKPKHGRNVRLTSYFFSFLQRSDFGTVYCPVTIHSHLLYFVQFAHCFTVGG